MKRTNILLIISILLLPFSLAFTPVLLTKPQTVYRVYLKGESLGLIKSKDELNKYIDKKQEGIKTKYHVDKVYAPSELKITKEITYSNDLLSIEEIYKKIENTSPFTINGYVVKIGGISKASNEGKTVKTKSQKIYVLQKDVFTTSAENTAKSFVTADLYKAYADKEQKAIKDTGTIIENIYIKNKVTIKKDKIPIDKKIYQTSEELSKYLLFGTTEDQQQYTVKQGDTLDEVAFNNKMSVEEIMVANPDIKDKSTLLYPGQVLKVGIIKPQMEIVEEDHQVKREQKHYTTETKNDNSQYTSYQKVEQQGVNGENKVTKKKKKINGEVTNTVTISTEILKEPIKEIVIKGTKQESSGRGSYSGGGYGSVVPTKGIWGWPATCSSVSSGFGYRWGYLHDGTDINGCGYGSNIFAAQSGTVVQSSYKYDNGEFVTIDHHNGVFTMYAHLSARYVKVGDSVNKGQVIGAMGQTGFATGVHLHYGFWIGYPYHGGYAVNAMNYY